ncbi:MAG: M48 family metalloprotease [Alphaproteobacteria bacterium]
MTLSRRHFCGLAACTGLTLGLGGCTVNPATGKQDLLLTGAEDEKRLGMQEHPKILQQFGGVYDDPAAGGYVAAIGGRLAAASETPDLGFTFTLLNSPIVNAFALPGGFVYISRGLMTLAEDEAELAGVLGHEIGHVVARHSAQRQSRAVLAQLGAGLLGAIVGGEASQLAGGVAGLYLQSYSRDQELEADMLGIRYLRRVGYDATAMTSFLEKMRANSQLEARIAGRSPSDVDAYDIMATHPRTIARVQQAAELAANGAQASQIRRRDTFLDTIDGMIFGDGPDQGFIRGQRFVHPELRFEFTVPDGFILRNTPEQVIASSSADQAQILFDNAPRPFQGSMSSYLAREWASGVRLNAVETLNVNGFEAATGTVSGQIGNTDAELRLLAIRFDSRQIFRFIFLAPTAAMRRLTVPLQRTTFSFRRITPAQAAALKPWRLQVVQTSAGATAETFVPRMAFDEYPRERFLVLNGLMDSGSLNGRDRVKLVVE